MHEVKLRYNQEGMVGDSLKTASIGEIDAAISIKLSPGITATLSAGYNFLQDTPYDNRFKDEDGNYISPSSYLGLKLKIQL